MSCSSIQRLVAGPSGIFDGINPPGAREEANCPETADALNDFLRTGLVRRIRTTASGFAVYNFARGIRWSPAMDMLTLVLTVRRMARCAHAVVRGTRANPGSMTADHYFVVFKYNNLDWAADALTREIHPSVQAYVEVEPLATRMTTFSIASSYDIDVSDPAGGLGSLSNTVPGIP